jgi:hypothetical protein
MALFMGCLIHGLKRGGGGNDQRMRCGARGSGSRRQGQSPASVWKEEEGAGWAEWGEKAKRAGWLAGPKSEENFFFE